MCTTCGCATNADTPEGQAHTHGKEPTSILSYSRGTRVIEVEQSLLTHNNRLARSNREHFKRQGMFVLNVVSSPGSGKTTLLIETIKRLHPHRPLAVIEGDQQTDLDAERIRASGVHAVQINTGKMCHLDAHMVAQAVQQLAPAENTVLFIENVGNLVCPALFDLGEHAKVLILSVTEGEDKPVKYPDMFCAARLLLLNKVDLLPYVQFDVNKCMHYAKQVNQNIEVIQLSATTGFGMTEWIQWIEATAGPMRQATG